MKKLETNSIISSLDSGDKTPETGNCKQCNAVVHRLEAKFGDNIIYHLPDWCDNCIRKQREVHNVDRKELDNLGIRPKFEDKTFETFEVDAYNEQAFKICQKFTDIFPETKGKGLYLYGGTGTGKTHLGISLLRAVGRGFVINAAELMDEISYRNSDILKRCIETPLLILDDIGAEQMSKEASLFVRNRFYRIINERYEYNRPTILTTNIVPEELKSSLGERISSRITEMCVAVRVAGRDRRAG